jgi:uncharacterized protein (DUF58 family)
VADALGAWLGSAMPATPAARPDTPRRPLPRRAVVGHDSGSGIVVRSGPGSGSSGIFSAAAPPSPGGSGSLARTPSPSSITRAQLKPLPRPAAEIPPVRIDTASPAAASGPTKPRRPHRDIAGLPLGAWIAVALGVLLAIGLAVAVALK